MREILFRGKRKDNGEWISGGLRQWSETSMGICDRDLKRTFPVRPETVGQFTGLKDRHGKKIFEGDIMRNAGNVVEFCNGSFCVNGDSPLSLWTNTEIIGNIHDNPELLNK